MHELSIARALLDVVEEAAPLTAWSRVTALRIELAEDAGLKPDALRLAIELLAEGTHAQGAEVSFEGSGVAEQPSARPLPETIRDMHSDARTHPSGDEAGVVRTGSVRLVWIEGE